MDLVLENPIPLTLSELVPPVERFAHTSRLHGPDHVGRVMIHAFLLLRATNAGEEAARLWASAKLGVSRIRAIPTTAATMAIRWLMGPSCA